MSYVVFALKWRPQTFDSLVGQEHVVNALKNAIAQNRVASAYLFSGPRGVGKTSMARIFAKGLNCKNGPTPQPCGACSSCLEIANGTSLDVLEIDGASNRGIDEIRTLRENVKFSPVKGKYKIYIIDEVHQITPDGFNALLKTLEEPPPYVKFIFATTQPHKVISTILSRCQRLEFRRLTVKEIMQQLERIVAAEKLVVEKDVLFAIAKSSDGALRDAESLLDQLAAFAQERISVKDVVALCGLIEQDVLFDLVDSLIRKDAASALQFCHALVDQGKDLSVFLTSLIEHYRHLMITKVSPQDTQLVDMPEEVCARLSDQAKLLSLEQIFRSLAVLVNTFDVSKRLESLRIPLEISLVRLACGDLPADRQVKNNPQQAAYSGEKIRQGLPAAPAKPMQVPNAGQQSAYTPERPPQPGKGAMHPKVKPVQDAMVSSHGATAVKENGARPIMAEAIRKTETREMPERGMEDEPMPSVAVEEVKEAWEEILKTLTGIKISVATYLTEGIPLNIRNNMLTISFPKNCSLHKDALETRENRTIVERSISQIMKRPLKICFELSQKAPPPATPADNPFVQTTLELFNGRVIKEE